MDKVYIGLKYMEVEQFYAWINMQKYDCLRIALLTGPE